MRGLGSSRVAWSVFYHISAPLPRLGMPSWPLSRGKDYPYTTKDTSSHQVLSIDSMCLNNGQVCRGDFISAKRGGFFWPRAKDGKLTLQALARPIAKTELSRRHILADSGTDRRVQAGISPFSRLKHTCNRIHQLSKRHVLP